MSAQSSNDRTSNRFLGRQRRCVRSCVAYRAGNAGLLYLVHVAESKSPDEYDGFPHVRQLLARWGLMNESDPPEAVGKLGIKVAKIGLKPHDPLRALLHFLRAHPSDLIVLATHGRDGVAHWLHGSIAEELSRAVKLPTLFVPPTARGFVDQNTGKINLSQVLVPVDHSPSPAEAFGTIREFVNSMHGARREDRTAARRRERAAVSVNFRWRHCPGRIADRRRGQHNPEGSGGAASRPDRHADRRPPRFSRCGAGKHLGASAAACPLPSAGDTGRTTASGPARRCRDR